MKDRKGNDFSRYPENEIQQFFHCAQCLEDSGDDPYTQWIEVGWTERGLQVWCRYHERDIINLDFMGQKVRTAGPVS